MSKPSTSKWRALGMAMLAALIACHPAMSVLNLAIVSERHADKIDQLSEGTYTLGQAISASLTTLIEGLGLGWAAFIFTLPIALLFGLSTHVALLKAGLWKKRHYAIAGAVMGTVAYTYFVQGTQGGIGLSFQSVWNLLLGTFTGLIAAVFFRLFMGSKGNPDGASATWHNSLFETPHLPKHMPFKTTAAICASSGLLLAVVGLCLTVFAYTAANLPSLLFSALSAQPDGFHLLGASLESLLHPSARLQIGWNIVFGSVLFTVIYITLRRMNKTGPIAFALAGFIDGPIVFDLLVRPISNSLIYGGITLPSLSVQFQSMLLTGFSCAITAVIFRAILERITAKEKGRNVSAPAS